MDEELPRDLLPAASATSAPSSATTSYLERLLSRAFHSMAGENYHRYRERRLDGPAEPPLFYELSLLTERPWQEIRDRVFPSFSRYVKEKSLNPEVGSGVVVAVFHGERCHLVRGEDFVALFVEMEGSDPEGYRLQVRRWLNP